jgi:uncharacterized protein (TIGR00251 family)
VDDAEGGDSRTAARPAWLEVRADGVVLALHVQPGARRTAVVGTHGDRLKIAVVAPPAAGQANRALLEFLAGRLGVGSSRLEVMAGASGRAKRVLVRTPLAADVVAAALMPPRRQ